MTISSRFAMGFRKVFSDHQFDRKNSFRLCPQDVNGYVCRRFISECRESLTGELEFEDHVLSMLSRSDGPSKVYLVGDAGSGKSTFLQFVLFFYRYWSSYFVGKGPRFDRCVKVISESGAEPNARFHAFNILVPERGSQTDVDHHFQLACVQLRTDLMREFPQLPFEDDFAFIRCHREGPTSSPDGTNPAQNENNWDVDYRRATELSTDEGKAREFCQLALFYLQGARKPSTARKKCVLLLDDSDGICSDFMLQFVLRLELLIESANRFAPEVKSSIVIAMRKETYRLRYTKHDTKGDSEFLELPPIDASTAAQNRALRFKADAEVEMSSQPSIIASSQFAKYYVPIPKPAVRRFTHKIIDTATAITEDDRWVFQQLIRPLCGNSTRRFLRFQKRIASSPIVDERIIRSLPVSNSQILLALLTGSSANLSAVEDEESVGRWFRKPSVGNGKFLSANAVFSYLANDLGNGDQSKTELVETLTVLGFASGEIEDTVRRLIQHCFIQDYSDERQSLHFNPTVIDALQQFCLRPVYLEILSNLLLRDESERRDLLEAMNPVSFEMQVNDTVTFISEICRHENQWAASLRSKLTPSQLQETPGYSHQIEEALRLSAIRGMGRAAACDYRKRLRSLSFDQMPAPTRSELVDVIDKNCDLLNPFCNGRPEEIWSLTDFIRPRRA